MTVAAVGDWCDSRRLGAALLGLAAGAILLRLWALDARVAHWDEARIAFWVLQYAASGEWTYHPVFHGPLLFHVERWLFDVLGPSDLVMRLPTAVVGSLLPVTAWLYRDHLENAEVLAMGLLLAANPILVYYSRFMRNDILVAAFSLAAFGMLLRLRASGRLRYAAGTGLFLALALGSKENAILYVLAWLGAALLLVGWRQWNGAAATTVRRPSGRQSGLATLAAFLTFVPTMVWVYAPRGGGYGSIEALLESPSALPAVLQASLVDPSLQAISFWALGSAQGEYPYHVFLGLLLGILLVGALATTVLAVVGLWRDADRLIVAFTGLWAVLSIVGYPAAADLMAGWTVLHVVVPLTIPAAVGLVWLWRVDGPAVPHPNRRTVLTAVGLYLVLSVGATSVFAPGSVYNPIGQPSQMSDEAGTTIDAVERALAGPDSAVVYVGPYWESLVHRLPLLWYVERSGGQRRFVGAVSDIGPDSPEVLVTHANSTAAISERYPAYRCASHERVPWAGGTPAGLPGEMLICVEPDRSEASG